MIQTFTAATIDSLTARMGARRLMRPPSMVATHLSHGSCAGINEQYRRADSISLINKRFSQRLLGVKIDGRMVYLWRAVDAEGEVLDVLVQFFELRSGGKPASSE